MSNHLFAEEYFGCAVPHGDDLVRVCTHGDVEGACESEIGELDDALPIDEQILRLQITVVNAPRVAKMQRLKGHLLTKVF